MVSGDGETGAPADFGEFWCGVVGSSQAYSKIKQECKPYFTRMICHVFFTSCFFLFASLRPVCFDKSIGGVGQSVTKLIVELFSAQTAEE